jgi:predicted DCC family thiol-disulfide oxidoreductase YuxK
MSGDGAGGGAEGRLLLVFDGGCGVCSQSVSWLARHDPAGRIEALPSQDPGVLDRLGLSRQDADESVWLLQPDGRRLRGAAAVNRVILELWPRFGRAVARLYAVPVLRRLEERAYAWFAAHRGQVSACRIGRCAARPGPSDDRRSERR